MQSVDVAALLGPELAGALSSRGYTQLTPVQMAVLAPELSSRDLRISSQTGSGKTVAIGITLRDVVSTRPTTVRGVAQPQALVVTPTRELAKQVEAELAWLYAARKVRVASVTGGASYITEQRALAAGPAILVGTPGRLLDHLRRKSIDPTKLETVVLDEADRMLDLGFRDDLEAILELAPEGHRTHLVSATFAREVQALANRVQHDPASVEGTPLGTANTDIQHVVHLVPARERVDALVNLLLADPEAQTLVFARTRADVARVADELQRAGFAVGALSGEMAQNARHQALSAFKRGDLRVLVATDVAARGIDHQDIARVVQLEPPTDPDTYTHRSGRTGRAGRKGMSSVFVAPAGLPRITTLLRRARVAFRVEPIPSAASISAAQDERLFQDLTSDRETPDGDARTMALAERITEAGHSARALARLLALTARKARAEARPITQVDARSRQSSHSERGAMPAGPRMGRNGHASERYPASERHSASERHQGGWTAFRVSWGEAQGADARRLLAMLCRRGNIQGSDIGAIRVEAKHSVVEIAEPVADAFERAVSEPDPRDPRVSIRRERGAPAASSAEHRAPTPSRAEHREHRGPPPSRAEHRASAPSRAEHREHRAPAASRAERAAPAGNRRERRAAAAASRDEGAAPPASRAEHRAPAASRGDRGAPAASPPQFKKRPKLHDFTGADARAGNVPPKKRRAQ